ncbi:MAG TPA: alpha-ketoglutarate-dependent dioxygenase AlkB [Allocoleopsis sp.]
MKSEKILMSDGEMILYSQFFAQIESDRLFEQLYHEIKWQQDFITLYGKKMLIPRLQAWYGDQGKCYTYSNIKMNPLPWTDTLLIIKNRIETEIKETFNSVLLNLYRHGQDSMGWHSDDEPELGQNPLIASVSFGQTRRFIFRHKFDKQADKIKIDLTNGSLLIMMGKTQHFWQHHIPKTTKLVKPRINLTWRIIH